MSNGQRDIDPQQERAGASRHRASTGRGRRVAVVGSAALLSSLLLVPAPGSADPAKPAAKRPPTISQVKAQLDTLNHQAEVASEAYNTVRVQMQQARERMTGLQADLSRERDRVATLRSQIVGAALSDYTSRGGLSTSSSFLVAEKPSEFIDALATTAVVEHRQTDLLAEFRQQQNQLGVQEQQAEREVAAIHADRAAMAEHKAAVEAKLDAAQKLLGRLKAKARARVLALQQQAATTANTYSSTSRGVERPPTYSSAPASGRAGVAVSTALAQLGDPYVWGTAGPSSFDCSGLTMYAWAAAGVALSHASSVQSQQGTSVSISALQPGDLVFYYSPVSHVGMYIGNGQIVHAPHTGSVVQIVPLTSMPISWARRVG